MQGQNDGSLLPYRRQAQGPLPHRKRHGEQQWLPVLGGQQPRRRRGAGKDLAAVDTQQEVALLVRLCLQPARIRGGRIAPSDTLQPDADSTLRPESSA